MGLKRPNRRGALLAPRAIPRCPPPPLTPDSRDLLSSCSFSRRVRSFSERAACATRTSKQRGCARLGLAVAAVAAGEYVKAGGGVAAGAEEPGGGGGDGATFSRVSVLPVRAISPSGSASWPRGRRRAGVFEVSAISARQPVRM